MTARLWLAEIEAWNGTTIEILRYSNLGFLTGPADTPANTFYAPRLKQAASLRTDMFADRTTAGRNRPGYGEAKLDNLDGELDGLDDAYAFDGRRLTIRLGEEGGIYPTDFPITFTATIESVELTADALIFVFRDRLTELDKPLVTEAYLGNNALPAGLEGLADIAGNQKPRGYGTVKNMTPVLVNTARLIHETGPCASVTAVYDKGVALTKGADYTSQSQMESTAPTSGQFRAWPAGGYFRLGSSPVGKITADVTYSSTITSAAKIAEQIALAAGVASGDITAADITALHADNSAPIGLAVTDSETAVACLDRVLGSVGAWYGFDALGKLRMGRLELPAGTPAVVFDQDRIISLSRDTSNDPWKGQPVWRVSLTYDVNETPQNDSDLGGDKTSPTDPVGGLTRRAWLATETRTAQISDASVKTNHPFAPELSRATLFRNIADADAEATRLMDMETGRDLFLATVRIDQDWLTLVDLGTVVELSHRRYGLSVGRLFTVIGQDIDAATGLAQLTLWG